LEEILFVKFTFHPEAEADLLRAIDYYEDVSEGLGLDFAAEVYSVIGRIIAFPKAWSPIDRDVRRCQTKRFPFGILYTEEAQEIYILAVMHLHREPNAWRGRTK
jgi:toxin ParE1/3/4